MHCQQVQNFYISKSPNCQSSEESASLKFSINLQEKKKDKIEVDHSSTNYKQTEQLNLNFQIN